MTEHEHCFCQFVVVAEWPGGYATNSGTMHKQCCLCGDRKVA